MERGLTGQSFVVFDAVQRRTLRELAELIEAQRGGLELADAGAAELDEAVVAFRDAADEGTAAEPGRALRTTARVGCSQSSSSSRAR